jgi:hypothetical protein
MDDLAKTRELLNRQLHEAVTADPLDALRAIRVLQRDIATHQGESVRAAVQQHSWAEVGEALGVSKQAAHQKFAKEWAVQLKDELKAEHRAFKAALVDRSPEKAAAAKAKRDSVIAEFKNAGRRHT